VLVSCPGCGDPVSLARDAYGLDSLCHDCAVEALDIVRELVASVYADEVLRLGLAALLADLVDDDEATP
jgi:hypothetical protein